MEERVGGNGEVGGSAQLYPDSQACDFLVATCASPRTSLSNMVVAGHM